MPQLKSRNARHNAVDVGRVIAGRVSGPNHSDHQGIPVHGCTVGRCENPIMDDSPTPLCAKHVRETYEFAQGVIADQLLVAAARLA